MHSVVLALHSIVRWLLLPGLLYAVYRTYVGWRHNKKFTPHDNSVRHWTATIAHIQFLLGIWLYIISPITNYFLRHYRTAVHEREIRFFGMEHSLMMLTAVTAITIGSIKAKRKQTDRQKFKTMAIWFGIGLLIILSSIPWPFSPLVHRPYLRPF